MHPYIAKSNPTASIARLWAPESAKIPGSGISALWFEQTQNAGVLTKNN
jgi:hypothetical protein